MKINKQTKGLILVNVLVFAVIAIVVTNALINWGATMLKTTRQIAVREQAFQIAEAGIEYYRWHLSHDKTDYTDGNATTTTGPFVHDFKDKDGNVVGQFSLIITPPPAGSSVVKIKSTGTVVDDPTVRRSIQATLAIPSLAKYAIVSADYLKIEPNTEVYGRVHSNNGIRVDGKVYNIITSAKDKYDDPEHSNPGQEAEEFGVHTHVKVPPEVGVSEEGLVSEKAIGTAPNRPDVFVAGRIFPVPDFDFQSITATLSSMKSIAEGDNRYFGSSGGKGYYVQLKENDSFDLYEVTSVLNPGHACRNAGGQTNDRPPWTSATIQSKEFLQNYTFPPGGTIFFEDDVWVDGQINTARITIAAGRFPDNSSSWKNITVNNNLLYTNYDGRDVIALIAQGNVNVGLNSADNLRIDAALVSQNGRVGRHFYSSDCEDGYIRNTLTLYGMIATKVRYGFSYNDGNGYNSKNITYDPNLLYLPPPNFPLSSDQYSVVSWEEVK